MSIFIKACSCPCHKPGVQMLHCVPCCQGQCKYCKVDFQIGLREHEAMCTQATAWTPVPEASRYNQYTVSERWLVKDLIVLQIRLCVEQFGKMDPVPFRAYIVGVSAEAVSNPSPEPTPRLQGKSFGEKVGGLIYYFDTIEDAQKAVDEKAAALLRTICIP